MSATTQKAEAAAILSLRIRDETDIVTVRRRARQLAGLLGFGLQDQVALATAVSEISRNAYQYAGGGAVDFLIDLHTRPQFLQVQISDRGPGIRDAAAVLAGNYASPTGMGLGISGTRRLTERFELESAEGKGTTVRFGKPLPTTVPLLTAASLGPVAAQLAGPRETGTLEDLRQQNQELLEAAQALRDRDLEISRRQNELARLNTELDETNRGVVALYAELDETTTALRRAGEVKSKFLSHVSHEFRTPVNSILALTNLLIRRTDGDLTGEQEKQVRFIRKAAEDLSEIVNDLLDLAKVEAGKTEVRPVKVDLGHILGAVRALMRPLATNDAVKLIFEEPPAALTIETDEGKLGQILRNLVSNALKFTERGEVRVSCRLCEDGRQIAISVADTGIGIAPQYIETVFQEFAQVENPLQRGVKGTGLGLPLSRKLAELLGGTLAVASELGAGSNFVLTLPARLPAREPGEPHDTASGTILIIDDEEAARYLCRQLFRGSRYRIIEAAGGSEGAERARFEKPALVILDLALTDRHGFDVLHELKSDTATRDIPIVIHTSKKLTAADHERLGGRHATVLLKETGGRAEAFLLIRSLLREPDLFSMEPEFQRQESGKP